MNLSATARIYFDKAIAWERFVLFLSFWIATAMFIGALVLGNFASYYLGLFAPIDLLTAGWWFLQALIGFTAMGTLINVVCLAATAASDWLGRKNARDG